MSYSQHIKSKAEQSLQQSHLAIALDMAVLVVEMRECTKHMAQLVTEVRDVNGALQRVEGYLTQGRPTAAAPTPEPDHA